MSCVRSSTDVGVQGLRIDVYTLFTQAVLTLLPEGVYTCKHHTQALFTHAVLTPRQSCVNTPRSLNLHRRTVLLVLISHGQRRVSRMPGAPQARTASVDEVGETSSKNSYPRTNSHEKPLRNYSDGTSASPTVFPRPLCVNTSV